MIFDILLLNNWYTCEFTNINVHKKIISLSFHGTHAMCHLSGLIESFFFLIIDKSKNMIYLCRMMAFREHYHALLKKSISFLYCGWNIVNKSQNYLCRWLKARHILSFLIGAESCLLIFAGYDIQIIWNSTHFHKYKKCSPLYFPFTNIWISLKAIKGNKNESLHSSNEASQQWIVMKWDNSLLLISFLSYSTNQV